MTRERHSMRFEVCEMTEDTGVMFRCEQAEKCV